MKYVIIFAVGVLVGSFGVVKTIHLTGRTINKAAEITVKAADTVAPMAEKAKTVSESALSKVSK